MDIGVQYLTFKISYVRFPDQLSINEYYSHYNEKISGGLIKISQILGIYQSF